MDAVRNTDPPGLEILDRSECLRLLRTVPVGRVVFTEGGLPAIRVVNFLVHGDTILFVTSEADEYRAAERGDVVAVEVDEVDAESHRGWTVTVVGRLSVVAPDEAAQLDGTLPLRSWAPQLHPRTIRLRAEAISGRRLDP
jgi:nitroimidazol reductase NimA-like FMN-containing flavoprotein (pyridoxamine 5'-phosphate oxidase superfamily)